MKSVLDLFPNVVKYWKYFLEAIGETLIIVSISIVLVILIGLLLGILLVIIDDGGICENKALNRIVPKVINVIRAVILVIALVLVVVGFINGGYIDVLNKAIRICYECIGIG